MADFEMKRTIMAVKAKSHIEDGIEDMCDQCATTIHEERLQKEEALTKDLEEFVERYQGVAAPGGRSHEDVAETLRLMEEAAQRADAEDPFSRPVPAPTPGNLQNLWAGEKKRPAVWGWWAPLEKKVEQEDFAPHLPGVSVPWRPERGSVAYEAWSRHARTWAGEKEQRWLASRAISRQDAQARARMIESLDDKTVERLTSWNLKKNGEEDNEFDLGPSNVVGEDGEKLRTLRPGVIGKDDKGKIAEMLPLEKDGGVKVGEVYLLDTPPCLGPSGEEYIPGPPIGMFSHDEVALYRINGLKAHVQLRLQDGWSEEDAMAEVAGVTKGAYTSMAQLDEGAESAGARLIAAGVVDTISQPPSPIKAKGKGKAKAKAKTNAVAVSAPEKAEMGADLPLGEVTRSGRQTKKSAKALEAAAAEEGAVGKRQTKRAADVMESLDEEDPKTKKVKTLAHRE